MNLSREKAIALAYAFGGAALACLGAQVAAVTHQGASIEWRAVLTSAIVAGVMAGLKYLVPPSFAKLLGEQRESDAPNAPLLSDPPPTELEIARARARGFGGASVLTALTTFGTQLVASQHLDKATITTAVGSSIVAGLVSGNAYVQRADKPKEAH